MNLIPEELRNFVFTIMEIMATVFIVAMGLSVLIIFILYILDRLQTKQAIRRNYPVMGRFRYLFEHFGNFFRQYFFAMDREEMPFNRAQRSWSYRAAKNLSNTVPFGSTQVLSEPGTILFLNSGFPVQEEEGQQARDIVFGPDCPQPYQTNSIFNISAMSYGAISKPAVQALSRGAAKAGCWLNTGEGGLSPFHLEGNADLVFQIGTAKYGIRSEQGTIDISKLKVVSAHKQVKMFELKLSQGAKPGKGGILPAVKVSAEIAAIRGIPEKKASISPNRHPEIDTVGDILDMIELVRSTTGKPVGFKCVLGSPFWLDDLFLEILSRGNHTAPDFITIDSADGGTGAAPLPLIDSVGLPLKESLPLVIDKLIEYGLRDRIKVICSGKLITPAPVAWALAMGADCITSARGFMFALGCVQALQCDKNTCPAGITTHNKRLQRGLVPEDKAERVMHYQQNMVKEVSMIAHSCGVTEPRSLTRQHASIVSADGSSVTLSTLHPDKNLGIKAPITKHQSGA